MTTLAARGALLAVLVVTGLAGAAVPLAGWWGGSEPEATASQRSSAPETVRAAVETDPVPNSGDAADDPAVWVNPIDPSLSAVIGTDKKGGLAVYDLSGRQLQYLPVGNVNNVDVRSAVDPATSFLLGGSPISLVVAGNRSENSIGIFQLVAADRQLHDIAARVIEPGIEVYGSCVYRSSRTGAFHVFVNSKAGEVEQWQLADIGSGRVDAQLVRSFDVGKQTEGCVADDELGHFYIGEETVGIWKYGAEPDAGTDRTLVASTSGGRPLAADVEGLTIAYGPDGTGRLIASSQGNNTYAMFDRAGDNDYLGSFRIDDAKGIDAVEETDGIDVTTAALGPDFPFGVFVAQDGRNRGGKQNFKLVPYEEIVEPAGR